MEFMAAIVAAAPIPRPVTIVTDSLPLCKLHWCVVKFMRSGRGAPLECRVNSDLLLKWRRILETKGEDAVKLEWVPSHRGSEAVEQGVMTEQVRKGNVAADH